MTVKVKFFAYFRDIFGSAEKNVIVPEGSTLEALLSALCDAPERRAEIFDGLSPKPEVIIMKNGISVNSLEGLRTRIADKDVIAVFPFMAGG